jgi:signal transduction histidine kinase
MAIAKLKQISNRFYKTFIESRQHNQQLQNREVVSNVVLVGTTIAMGAFFVLLLISYIALQHDYVFSRLVICAATFLYLGGVFWLSRAHHYRASVYGLVIFYTLLASSIVWQFGVGAAVGMLMFGLVIVLASTLLSARHALYSAAVACAVVLAVKIGVDNGVFSNDAHYTDATLGDTLGCCVVFTVLAVISWLFGRQVERSLARAVEAEAALQQEKAMLKVRVRERTLQLRRIQVEEMQQMYNFAEIGQLSTALLHDLANYLTVLTVEMESLRGEKYSDTIERTQQIVGHLDNMVDNVRDRLQGNVQESDFNLADQISEVLQIVRFKAGEAHVNLQWSPPSKKKDFEYRGDPIRFSQVVTILVTNAIDAYRRLGTPLPDEKRPLQVTLSAQKQRFILKVTDWGGGISKQQRKQLFRPLQSNAKHGMGIGLYITKQMVELHFKGSIVLDPSMNRTEFSVILPRKI